MTDETVSAPAPTAFQTWEKDPEAVAVTDEVTSSATATPAEADEPEAKTAPDSDPVTQENSSEDEKLPSGLKKRFRELTTKIKNLEAEAAERLKTPAPPKPAEPVKADAPPVVEGATPKPESKDFETYEGYIEALQDWKFDQRELAARQQAQRVEAEKAAKTRSEAWEAELAAARERYDDFNEVALTDMPINRATHEAIIEGGRDGAELAYYLGQHKDEAAAIFKMTPIQTVLALGKIAAKLSSEDATENTKPAQVTKAPRPPKTVAGSGTADLGKEPDPKDFAKWNKWKDRQEALAA